MTYVMAAAGIALFAVWIVTGVRMVLLGRRTGGGPELLLGWSLLFQSGIGFPLSMIAPFAGDVAPLVWFVSSACVNAGMVLLFAFTARVFHDSARWSWMIVGASIPLVTIQAVGNALGQRADEPDARLASLLTWAVGSITMSGLSWGWTGFEALRFHASLRKRAALGLADPVVANRMLLWGAMGAIAFGCVVANAIVLYTAGDFARTIVLPTLTASCGLLVSVCMILAFWPPKAYLDYVRGSAAGA
jgi:hypothetical protein